MSLLLARSDRVVTWSVSCFRWYKSQKKTLEINPRHPLVKELQRRVEKDEEDTTNIDLAQVLFDTAVLRSGFSLSDSATFAGRIERMLRLSMGVDKDAPVSFTLPTLSLFTPLSPTHPPTYLFIPLSTSILSHMKIEEEVFQQEVEEEEEEEEVEDEESSAEKTTPPPESVKAEPVVSTGY